MAGIAAPFGKAGAGCELDDGREREGETIAPPRGPAIGRLNRGAPLGGAIAVWRQDHQGQSPGPGDDGIVMSRPATGGLMMAPLEQTGGSQIEDTHFLTAVRRTPRRKKGKRSDHDDKFQRDNE